ncbi:MAG TPA: hypothetical protein VHV57_14015 [Acidimicrobiales bacterium]|nr:hypothetical protein [Acidimicrobiales bacterium]
MTLTSGLSAGAASTAVTAKAAYEAAIIQAGQQNLHFVSKATQQGIVLGVVGDAGKTSGSQVLIVQSGPTVETLEAILIGVTGYVRGNTAALERILGLTAAQSKKYASTWLAFPITNTTLADLVGGLQDKDIATELQMGGPYSFGPSKTIAGHATQAIDGFAASSSGAKVPVVLYVEKGKTPRPVQEVTNPKKVNTTIQGTVTFSKWGEATHTKVPSHVVSLNFTPPTTSTPAPPAGGATGG